MEGHTCGKFDVNFKGQSSVRCAPSPYGCEKKIDYGYQCKICDFHLCKNCAKKDRDNLTKI